MLEGRGHPGSTSQIVFFAPRWAVRRAPVTQETQPGVFLSWKLGMGMAMKQDLGNWEWKGPRNYANAPFQFPGN